jgi:hypothetical protein
MAAGGADHFYQVRVQQRVTAAELQFLHAQGSSLLNRAQREIQRHVPGIRAARPGRFRERQHLLAIRHHVAVIVLPQIAVRAAVITEHCRLEHELLEPARRSLRTHSHGLTAFQIMTDLSALTIVTRPARQP